MNRSVAAQGNVSNYRQIDYRSLSITLLGENNQTLEGTVNLTTLVVGSGPAVKDYDATGAAYYVCAVILVYGLSIVLLIGSLAKKKTGVKGQLEKEEKQILQYLHKAPDLKEMSARDNYRQLKRDIITLVSNTTPASTPSTSIRGPPSLASQDSPKKNHGSLETLLEENSRQASVDRETPPDGGHSHTGHEGKAGLPAQPYLATLEGPLELAGTHGPAVLSVQMETDQRPPRRIVTSPKRHASLSVGPAAVPGKAVAVDKSPSIPRVNKSHRGWPNPFADELYPPKDGRRDKSPARDKLNVPKVVVRQRSPDRSAGSIRRDSRPPRLQPFVGEPDNSRIPARKPSHHPDEPGVRKSVHSQQAREEPGGRGAGRPHPQLVDESPYRRSRSPGGRKQAHAGQPAPRPVSSTRRSSPAPAPSSRPRSRTPSPLSRPQYRQQPGDRRSRSPEPVYLSPFVNSSQRETDLTRHPSPHRQAAGEEGSPARYKPSPPYAGRRGQWGMRRRSPSPSNPLLRAPSPPRDDSPCHSETEELLQVTCV